MLDSDPFDYLFEDNIQNNNENNIIINGINAKELDSSLSIEDKFDPMNQQDLNSLVEMGYDAKMAKKIFILLKPKDINEAIDFLTQENGIYQHDFMERHGKKDICFICGESAKRHINFIPPESKRKSLVDSIRESLDNEKE